MAEQVARVKARTRPWRSMIAVVLAITAAAVSRAYGTAHSHEKFTSPDGLIVLGAAILGVLLGIAAQQTLANLFAGIVLLQAHPFEVGDLVWIRSGALGGQYEGEVIEIGLTYVRLDSENGPVALPNTQVLAAATGPLKPAPPALARPSDPSD